MSDQVSWIEAAAKAIGDPFATLGALLTGFVPEGPLRTLVLVIQGLCVFAAPVIYKYYLGVLAQGAKPEGSLERQDYDRLRASLAGGNLAARLYANWLTAFLDGVDRFFGDSGMADRTLFPHALGLKKPAPLWTAPAFDRCLFLALIYPIATIFLIWAISGHVGPAEAALGFGSDVPGISRGLGVAAIGFSSFAFWRAILTPGRKRLVWFALTLVGTGAGAFPGVVVVLVAGAVAFAGVIAFAGAGARAVAGAFLVAGAVTGAFLVVPAVADAFGFTFDGPRSDAYQGAFAVVLPFAVAVTFTVAFAGAGAGAGAGAFTSAFAVAFAFAIKFAGGGFFIGTFFVAIVFAGVIAFTGAGAGCLAGFVAFAFVLAGVIIVSVPGAGIGAGTGALAGVVAIAVAVAVGVSLLNKRAIKHRGQGIFQSLFLPAMVLACLLTAKFSETVGPLMLFQGLLTLLNAPFDWASLGLTRALLRRGLELGGWWPYLLALVDACLAGVIIAFLALTMVICVQAFDELAAHAGGAKATVLPLPALFEGIAKNPAAPEYWWAYVLLLSTMIPSLINLAIGGMALTRGIPGVPRLLLRWIPGGRDVPDYKRQLTAVGLTFQMFSGAFLGIAAQALLAWGIIFHVMPWVGLDLLAVARAVAAFDVPLRAYQLFAGIL